MASAANLAYETGGFSKSETGVSIANAGETTSTAPGLSGEAMRRAVATVVVKSMVDDGGRSSPKLRALRAEASTVELKVWSDGVMRKAKEGFSSGVAAGKPSDPRTSISCGWRRAIITTTRRTTAVSGLLPLEFACEGKAQGSAAVVAVLAV